MHNNGKEVKFVAHPDDCSSTGEFIFYRPDDIVPCIDKTWRQELDNYNDNYIKDLSNPFRLSKAFELYMPKKPNDEIYQKLVDQYGEENVFILSAGWGLVRSDFLLPYYNITFSTDSHVPRCSRRNKDDFFRDYNQLRRATTNDTEIHFFGGQGYLPLYFRLTQDISGIKIIHHYAEIEPKEANNYKRCYKFKPYTKTKSQRTWHYLCARDFMDGNI